MYYRQKWLDLGCAVKCERSLNGLGFCFTLRPSSRSWWSSYKEFTGRMSCRVKASSILSSVMATIAMSLITSTTHSTTTTFTTTKSKIRPSDGPINMCAHTHTHRYYCEMKSVVLDYRRQSRWSIGYIVENNNKIIKYRFLLKSLCISLNFKTQYSIHKGKYRLASWLTLKPTLTQRHHRSSLAHSSGFSSQPTNVGSKRRCTCWEREWLSDRRSFALPPIFGLYV